MNQERSEDMLHYVYIYLNPLEPGDYSYNGIKMCYKPFYVGVGIGRRYYFHITEAKSKRMIPSNPYKTNIIKKILKSNLLPHIIFIKSNISRNDALIIEREIISVFGNIYTNGVLSNMTDGGEKCSTILNHPNKEEIIRKFKIRSSGKNNSMFGKYGKDNPNSYLYLIVKDGKKTFIYGGDEKIKWMKNESISPVTFQKLVDRKKLSHNGVQIFKIKEKDNISKIKILSPTQVKKYEDILKHEGRIAAKKNSKLKGKRKYKITFPNGKVEIVNNFSNFCKKYHLHRATFRQVAYGTKDTYRGWKCCFI